MRRWGRIGATALVLLGLAPALLRWSAAAVAALAGCSIDGEAALPCLVFATEVGPALHGMWAAGPLILMTVPFVACGAILFVLTLPKQDGSA